ncbi:Mak10-domain-containing protein [Trametes sanguinea]|nr:Mak10-domain-containing protein [Trametes sanguinea]
MVGYSGFDDYFEIPGGDDFVDITELVVAGARDMEPEEVLLMDGFTLMDAMSAFEIGEPRLDSGMILEEQRRPPFNPLTPLLPEEVCWILDRSFACEMEWHAGKTLSQSVFTLLFVHHLPDINPEYLPAVEHDDPARPQWLLTVVVRAAMLGLLKCCDLAWRELSKNRVNDVEDWQGEKCDVSLLEGVNAEIVSRILDNACDWLRRSHLSEEQVAALCDRLLLRKNMLQLYRADILNEPSQSQTDAAIALALLHKIRTTKHSPIPPDSPALLAMDPYIARRLPNFMPIRVTELPSQEKIWEALEGFLDYWQEVCKLVASPLLLKWEAAGSVRFALGRSVAPPYHRSLIQSLFFDRNLVLGVYPTRWLVDHFFQETIGLSYGSIQDALERSAPQPQLASMQDIIERRISQLVVPHVRSNWFNPPRRRRHLMKEVLQWHILCDMLQKDVDQHCPSDVETASVLRVVPRAAQMWRLSATREVILSGFQQELYAPEEKPIAYWYLSRVLDTHLECIEEVLPLIPQDTPAFRELSFQAEHLTALEMISTALVSLTAGYITSPWRRISLNFVRRYKWLFNPDFERLPPAHPIPDLRSFPNALKDLLLDELYSPSASLELAQNILVNLAESSHDWLGYWEADRKEYLRNMAEGCDRLKRIAPANLRELPNFDLSLLKWRPEVHPWMPTSDS